MGPMRISTHVLDTMRGQPARGVLVRLEAGAPGEAWKNIGEGRTNADGRIADFLPAGSKLEGGVYRLVFETGGYFASLGQRAFYPTVEVTFEVLEERHLHVPLLLSPFGYTTYRGS